MKKIIALLVLVSMLLAGCGASDVPADTPTVQPTDTRPPPTKTPEPTATPTPEPTSTPTPTPTPEPTLIPMSDLLEEMGLDHMATLLDAELSEFEGGYYRWAIGLNNSILERWTELKEYPYIYFNRAGSYARLGDFDSAIKDLETAVKLPYMDDFKLAFEDPDSASQYYTEDEIGDISTYYNNLCWYLAITDQPDRALPYCEEAVAMFPSMAVMDSRAVVYGMLGRTEEAISDFEHVLGMGEDDEFGFYTEMIEERQQWLEAIKNGENPFTPELLEKLRLESIDPNAYPDPELLEDYSRPHFSQILKQDGFVQVDSGVNDSGVEYEMYGLKFGTCYNYIVLFGPESEIMESRMLLMDCTEDQFVAEMRWFAKLLLMSNPREDNDCIALGEWFAWELTELQDLVDGTIDQTEEFSVRQLTFVANREEDEERGTVISIYGW